MLGLAEETREMYGSIMIGLALLRVAKVAIRGRDLLEPPPPEPAIPPR